MKVVKRWLHDSWGGCGKWFAVQLENGLYDWENRDGVLLHANLYGRAGVTLGSDELKRLVAAEATFTDPTWAAPATVPQVAVCRYAEAQPLLQIKPEPLDICRGQLGHAYDAPVKEQEQQAADRVIKRALRQLRELPICSVSGEPVEVRAEIRKLYNERFYGHEQIAVLACPTCCKA